MLSKDKLIYDATTPADGDSVAAFLRTGTAALTSTGTALDVNIASSTGLGIFAEDSAHASGDLGQQILAVRQDTEGSLVSADGDYSPLSLTATGRLRVDAEVSVTTGSDKAEDSAHASGDIGTYILGVRQDTLANSTSADGDYGSLKLDSLGRLWTNAAVSGDVADDAADSGNPLKIGTKAINGALTAISAGDDRANAISDMYRRLWVTSAPNAAGSNAAVSVDTTAGGVTVFATPIEGRMEVEVQNLGNKAIYLGFGTVTSSNGIRVAGGATWSRELGPDVILKAIADSGTQDVRVMQLA
ncbi:MAG: hypothetical protein E6R04_04760 [Spirochaetes bacterium]|nr:MAG: hypothetical protein E6R04_04760 [Spirochaetota bacterium]